MVHLPSFPKDPGQFIRNPLGLIGLFIVLIYGFGALVAGASPELTADQRWILVWFVVLFPPAVLTALYRLVTKHHSKLYAPADWKDERLVYGPQTHQQIAERETREAAALEETTAPLAPEGSTGMDGVRTSSTPMSRAQSVALIREAEALALAELEKTVGKAEHIVTNVRTAVGTPDEAAFDAAVLDENLDTLVKFIDIRVIRNAPTLNRQIARIVREVRLATNRLRQTGDFTPVQLVVVGLDMNEEQRRNVAEELHQALSSVSVDSLVYSIAALRNGSTR